MRTKEVIEGLQILQKYRDWPDGFDLGAEHDVLHAFSTSKPLNEADLNRMIELGWHQEHDGRDYNEEFSAKEYRQDESWLAFV